MAHGGSFRTMAAIGVPVRKNLAALHAVLRAHRRPYPVDTSVSSPRAVCVRYARTSRESKRVGFALSRLAEVTQTTGADAGQARRHELCKPPPKSIRHAARQFHGLNAGKCMPARQYA
jgi:hypothetical protein